MRAVVVVAGLLVLLGMGTPSAAQDGPPPVETVVAYYENEMPDSLGMMLLQWNVCFERFVTLNPELEIDNIPYGTRVLLPKDEPCYDYNFEGSAGFPSRTPPRLKYFEESHWLIEPYYSDEIIYRNYPSIEAIVREFGICRADLLADNYGLQVYDDRYLGIRWPAADIFIPHDKRPCEDETSPSWLEILRPTSSFLPMDLTAEFNICPEEMPYAWGALYQTHTDTSNSNSLIQIPQPAPPCYNEEGQRLVYFDIDGKPLDEPEYSDLQVYRVQPGQTLAEIADRNLVCRIDLARLNYFPDLPIARGEIELFIPESGPCSENAYMYQPSAGEIAQPNLTQASVALNVCYEILAALNPHLQPTPYFMVDRRPHPGPYRNLGYSTLLFAPDEAEPCYTAYAAQRGESIYDIERALNICHEAFLQVPYFDRSRLISTDETVLYIRRDTPPCYNAQGQRLQYKPVLDVMYFNYSYHDPYQPELKNTADYAEMGVHIFERADTVYSVSRQYNVCVHDLLKVNPMLRGALPEGFPTFIPETRPCNDEATGMPLIYEDENGDPLDEPRVGDKLIYYGTEPFGRVSYYYNVCENRIEEANAAKLAGEAHYLGWIIPHDRPPCYDEDGYVMDIAMRRHVANGGIVHTVQYAETLSEIAEQYDKSIYWIADANNLSSVDMIWIEQKLIIPGGVTTRDVKLISAALIGLAAVGAVVLWRRKAK